MLPLTTAQLNYELTLNLIEFIIVYFIVVFVFYTWRRIKLTELLILTMAFSALMLKNLLVVYVDYRQVIMGLAPFEPTYSIASYTLETLGYILVASSLLLHFFRKYKKYVAYFFYGIVILLVLFLMFQQMNYARLDADNFAKFGSHLNPRNEGIHTFSEIYNIVFLFFGFFVVFNNWKSEKSKTLIVMMVGIGLWILAHMMLIAAPMLPTLPEFLKTGATILLAFSLAVKKELPITVVPARETSERKVSEAKHQLKPNTIYYFREDKPNKTFECFVDQVMHGKEGLCITRTYPDLIRKQYGLSKTPIIWLTQTPTEKFKYIKPTSLVQLENILEEFMKESRENLIMIDGVEYLITQNNFSEVLKFFQTLFEKVALMDSILVLPLNHTTMDSKEFNLLVENMEELH